MEELKGKRILVVEDNVTNMAVFATTLKRLGALVIQDAWNSGTVDMLKKRLPIDLIILDLMLRRDASGYDLFDALQQDPELKDIPVVAVSSLDPETEIPKAQERGMAGFISKPININKFPQQLAQVLAGEKVWVTSR